MFGISDILLASGHTEPSADAGHTFLVRSWVARGLLHVEHFVIPQDTVEVSPLDVNLVQEKSKTVGHCNECA